MAKLANLAGDVLGVLLVDVRAETEDLPAELGAGVGVGEGVEDLRPFDPREFATALLAD